MKLKQTTWNLIVFFLILISQIAFSQKPPQQFGKISEDELTINVCPIDSNAHAWIIFDYGKSGFEYANTVVRSNDPTKKKGFQLYFTRHLRLKFSDNQGFNWANIEIPLYREDDKEQLTSVKAQTYNFEKGKIITTKLDRNDIFTEETSLNWVTVKFAMPNIREGSVIEVEYTIKSDFYFNLRPWYFQQTIPVLKSEYHVAIPEYFSFNQTQKGYYPFQWKSEMKQKELSLNYYQQAEGSSVKQETYNSTYRYNEHIFHFQSNEVPAFPDEEFLRTAENYLSKIEFELHSTKFPNALQNNYTTSWETINRNLMNNTYFGKEIGKASHLEYETNFLKGNHTDNSSLLAGTFEYVKNKMVWNGIRSKYVSTNLGKAWKDGGGNAADINLNLVNLFNALGLKSYPVILSTQDNGIIHPAHPSLSSFNYVIAMVEFEGDTLLFDACDKHAEVNLLPVRCLNDRGWIVNGTGGNWIDLMDYKSWISNENYFMTMDNNLRLNGQYQSLLKDYAKYQLKNEFHQTNGHEGYQKILETSLGCVINNMIIDGVDSLKDVVKVSFEITKEGQMEKANDLVLFRPAFRPFISKNPFRLEKRLYPVEYNYPFDMKQVYTFSIADDYSILELPEPLNIRTPDGSIRYIYSASQVGNSVYVTIGLSLNRTLFLPQEYEMLKNFYQMIVDKQNETVVLKMKG